MYQLIDRAMAVVAKVEGVRDALVLEERNDRVRTLAKAEYMAKHAVSVSLVAREIKGNVALIKAVECRSWVVLADVHRLLLRKQEGIAAGKQAVKAAKGCEQFRMMLYVGVPQLLHIRRRFAPRGLTQRVPRTDGS